MANFVFNIAKGRVAEYFNRVDKEDPSTSRIVVIPMKASGTEANGQDADDFAAVEASTGFDEQTEGWSRKTVTAAEISAVAADDTENKMKISLPAITWTAPTSGKNTTGLVVVYDPKIAEGADSELIPLVHLDFAVTADGNDVELKAGEIFRAS